MPMISTDGRMALLRQWAGSSPIGRLAPGLAARWQRYSIRRARQATIAILQTLDDRRLKDIGLRRDEIERVVYDDKAERLLR